MKFEKAFLIILISLVLLISHQKHSEKLELKQVQKVSYYNLTDSEKLELQKIAIAEANGEGVIGMAYVIQTVINRKESDVFPNTIEGVIYAPGQFTNCSNVKPTKESAVALFLFDKIENKGQLYFENVSCSNTWASNNKQVCFIYNNHRFYM